MEITKKPEDKYTITEKEVAVKPVWFVINGAKIKTTEMILFELIKTSKHEKFKSIQALIK